MRLVGVVVVGLLRLAGPVGVVGEVVEVAVEVVVGAVVAGALVAIAAAEMEIMVQPLRLVRKRPRTLRCC